MGTLMQRAILYLSGGQSARIEQKNTNNSKFDVFKMTEVQGWL